MSESFESPVIGSLDLNDPEEKKYAEELDASTEELKRETLEKFPTPDDAIEPYRQGIIGLDVLRTTYSSGEVEVILKECEKRNAAKNESAR